ncbi:MAG: carbamoyltransferase C-terminal domain-containing protein, partial [Owenweeksia sp.]
YCLDAEGIKPEDLDLVVQTANFEIPDRLFFHGERLFKFPDKPEIVNISHHLAHAYSAIGTCPFDKCYVMVIDGCGSPFSQYQILHPELPGTMMGDFKSAQEMICEKDSFYYFDGKHLHTLQKDFSPMSALNSNQNLSLPTTRHSIGGFYAAVSHYVFGNMDDVGKLMGLAPFGRTGIYDQEAFIFNKGRLFMKDNWSEHLTRPSYGYEYFNQNFEYYANIAKWAQEQVEKAVLYCIGDRLKDRSVANLCYTGGVALNAVANARLLDQLEGTEVYFEPAAGDNGLALGCAYYGWLHYLGKKRVEHEGSTCFGRKYNEAYVERAVHGHKSEKQYTVIDFQDEPEMLKVCAQKLCEGKVIGWFQDGSEFGPRALGRRSILAHPGIEGLQDHINRNIKFREDFRPFAPAVQEENVAAYFEKGRHSPYMILVDRTRPEYSEQLKNVTHKDGSARVQTVNRKWNPRFWLLIEEFGKQSGIPVLLNTSLNKKGMPMVETPEEALSFFEGTDLDLLIMGRKMLLKK